MDFFLCINELERLRRPLAAAVNWFCWWKDDRVEVSIEHIESASLLIEFWLWAFSF